MSNLKRVLVALLMVCVVVGTSGCGGKVGFGSSDNSLSGSFSPKNDSIWYYVDEDGVVGKDSDLHAIFVFKDGESFIYPYNLVNSMNFGELSQKSDDEVIAFLADEEKKQELECLELIKTTRAGFEAVASSGIFDAPIDSFNDSYDFTADKNTLIDFSKSLENVSFTKDPTEIKFAVFTDSTGNATKQELISYRSSVFRTYNELYINFSKFGDASVLNAGKQDSYYGLHTLLSSAFNVVRTPKGGILLGNNHKSSGFKEDFPENGSLDPSSFYPVETNNIVVTKALDPATGSIKVYDNTYAGFFCEDGVLLTKEKGSGFVMDGLDKDGIPVDPKGSLFGE